MSKANQKSRTRMSEEINNDKIGDPKKRKKKFLVLIVFLIIIGVGIIINNISELYMHDKNTATVSTPHRVMQGKNNTILVSTISPYGKPLADKPVNIDLKYNDKTYHMYSGKTGESGSVLPTFYMPELGKEGENADLIITAGSETIRKQIELDTTIKVLISTDKPIYQPKQIVHIRAISFDEGKPVVGKDSVEVEVQAPDGNKIFRKAYTPNEFGIISLDYPLSDQLPMGNYKIIIKTLGSEAQKTILVKKYALPKIKIELEDIQSWYTIDEKIVGNLNCRYFFGKNVEGSVKIDIRSYYGVWESEDILTGRLEDGKFKIDFGPIDYAVGIPWNAENGLLELNITVTDTGGHKETKSNIISIARKPILLTLLADSNVVGTMSNHVIVARYPDGAPVKDAKIYYWSDNSRSSGYYQKPTTFTDDRGVAKIQYIFNDQRYLHIRINDTKTTVSESYYTEGTKGLKVIPDKATYTVGENAIVDVYYSGKKSATKWVYYDTISNGFVVTTGRIKLNTDNKANFKLPITSDMAPLTEVRVYKTQTDLNVAHDVALVGVNTEKTSLNVSIETDKQLYLPNDEIEFKFRVTHNNTPVQAALGISCVDQSVFEIHERFSGLEKVLVNLEDEFITPQYQICNYVYSPQTSSGQIPEETDNVISMNKLSTSGGSSMLVLAGVSQLNYANQLEDYYATYYWFVIIFLGLIGLIGLFILALRYKRAAALVQVLLILLPFLLIVGLIGASIYHSSTESELRSSNMDSGLRTTGGDADEEDSVMATGFSDDIWDDLNEPPLDSPAKSGSGGVVFEQSSVGLPGSNIDSNLDLPDQPKQSGDSSIGGGGGATGTTRTIQVRQYFPETWYWNPSLITDGSGTAELNLRTPDSITTWSMEAVASTKNELFGLGTKNVTVFKGFFIEPDIPASVIRNDEFPLKILIYNYEPEPANVTVTLYSADWYELYSNSTVLTQFVNASSVSSVDFRIKAHDVGNFKIKVDGDNGQKIDRVIKEVRVEPDGKAIEELKNGGLDNDQTVNTNIELLKERIPNSTNAYVKLQGGLEAVTLDGAENYIQFVSGCGEQSTSRLSVDIAAYRNLLKGDMTDEKLFKYENIIVQGIQHELMYLVHVPFSGGKAIVWHCGEPPDIWLTAWASFAFQDLEDAGFEVDERILDGFQIYLVSNQANDGSYSFPNVGHWSINSKLENEKLASTAYITRALLYSGYSKNSNSIKDSIKYIENTVNTDADPFTISLSLLALEMGDGSMTLRDQLANSLINNMQSNPYDNTVWWDYQSRSTGTRSRYYDTKDIETTGYAIMALHQHGGHGTVVNQAVKYLITQRTGGCFGSTHDTAVAFQALNSIDELKINNLTVTTYIENEMVQEINFNEYNQDITYYIDIRPYINDSTEQFKVTLESKGEGSIFYQIYTQQYLTWDIANLYQPPELELKVDYDTTRIKVNDQITATVTMKYMGEASVIKMVLLDLRAPVGFSFIESDFQDLLDNGDINNFELRDRQALVYVDDIEKGKPIKFSYSLLANKPIRGTIQGVHAFDMYDPNVDTELGPIDVESFE